MVGPAERALGVHRVLEPPGPYSLGTSDAPILITVANGLPVTMRVDVEILPSSGLRVAPIEPQEVPGVTAVRDATDHATGDAPYLPRDAA